MEIISKANTRVRSGDMGGGKLGGGRDFAERDGPNNFRPPQKFLKRNSARGNGMDANEKETRVPTIEVLV